MTETFPFQYALLRFSGDVETGEFINVGLVLYSPSQEYFRAQLLTRYERVTDVFPNTDVEFYRSYISRLQTRLDALGTDLNLGNPQEVLPEFAEKILNLRVLLERVLPTRDSALVFGDIHVGVTEDLDDMFGYLYSRFVLRHLKKHDLPSRTDDDVWAVFKRPLQERHIVARLAPAVIQTRREREEFQHTWRNGRLNILFPQSFDLVAAHSIKRKAETLLGKATVLLKSVEKPRLVVLAGTPRTGDEGVAKAYLVAKGMIEDESDRLSIEVVEEDRAEALADRVKNEIENHG